MASAFSHALVAVVLGSVWTRPRQPWKFWLLSVACALVPDADVIGFSFGVRYDTLWGHRGMSHSFCFALFLSVCVVTLACREVKLGSGAWWAYSVHFFTVTASHGVLDALTDGGLGVAFFAPFETRRYFFSWRPVRVSPISIRAFLSPWGLEVLRTELLWIWLPAGLLYAAVYVLRRR